MAHDRLELIKEICEKRKALSEEESPMEFTDDHQEFDPFAAMKEAGMSERDFG